MFKKKYTLNLLLLGFFLISSVYSVNSSITCVYKKEQNLASIINGFSEKKLIKYAKSFLGTPHKMGGTDKKGIDCSGFVQVCFKKFDIDLPHSADDQSKHGKKIKSKKKLKMGDIVFFRNTYKTKKDITHSGIYIKNGKFIHVSTKKGVVISDINDPYYWAERYAFASRIK